MSKRAARVSSEAGQQMECVLGHEELWSHFAPFGDHKPHVCATHDGATHFETTPSPASPVRVIAHLYGSFAVKWGERSGKRQMEGIDRSVEEDIALEREAEWEFGSSGNCNRGAGERNHCREKSTETDTCKSPHYFMPTIYIPPLDGRRAQREEQAQAPGREEDAR